MVVDKLQNDPHRFLATVQIGVTVVGSLASAVGGGKCGRVSQAIADFITLCFCPRSRGAHVYRYCCHFGLILFPDYR